MACLWVSYCPVSALIDLGGRRFGRWVALSRDSSRGFTYWWCVCDCGTKRSVYSGNLRRGITVSCGCYNDENRVTANIKHGGRYMPEYRVWCGIIQRCENPSSSGYPKYGGRGIKMCARYRSNFGDFIRDLGPRPSDSHTIDRKHNDIGYVCGCCDECKVNGFKPNCRWSLPHAQSRNKRNNIWMNVEGARMCAKDAAARVGIPYKTLHYRLQAGWSHHKALTTPLRK